MSGFEMFCERCGKRYGSESQTAAGSLPLARRFLRAVGVGANTSRPAADAPYLRFCLACRGYSCPECWNEDAGFCQTCVPLPEPAVAVEHVHEPIAAFAAEVPMEPSFDQAPPLVVSTAPEDEPLAPEAWATWPTTAPPALEPVLVLSEPVAIEPEAVDVEAEAEWVVAEAESESVVAEAEPVVAEAEPVVFSQTEAETEPVDASADAVVAEAEAEAEPEAMVVAEAEAEFEAVQEAVVAEAEPEPVVVEAEAEAYAEPEAAVAEAEADPEPILAMAERPIEFVVADDEPVAELEAEAEVHWDWALDTEETATPAAAEPVAEVEQPETVLAADFADQADDAVPVAAPEEEPVAAAEEPVAPVEPVAPAQPVYAPPIFRPLTPLGPIVAPPPPPSAPAPSIHFELPDVPPAFVIAPPRPTPVARPVLPFGLFDGPGPAIRPCSTCELPVSAKARFCRRCGSSQGDAST